MYIDYRDDKPLHRRDAFLALMDEDDKLDYASAIAILEEVEAGREAIALGQWDDSYYVMWMPETGDDNHAAKLFEYGDDTITFDDVMADWGSDHAVLNWAIWAKVGDIMPGDWPYKRIK